jgi:predicted dehydrogenase
MPWFWEGVLQGGGVLNDMMCHSVEVARHLLTAPGAARDTLKPLKVSAHTSCLKWQLPRYADILARNSGGKTDYRKRPSEDFARALVEFRAADGTTRIVEATTSWCFVGAGLRLSMELLGPEYSLSVNSLDAGPKIFFSREVQGAAGEDLVEKQNAEMGLMPVVSDEEAEYGYVGENRHMVEAFLAGRRPDENFSDGLAVTELLMAAYMSAEQERTVSFPPPGLDTFVPAVARGAWNPATRGA